MLRPFCDMCGKECHSGSTQTRRFEHLAGTKGVSLAVGLEVVFLFDGQPSQDSHVCNDCLLELLWAIARKNAALLVRVEDINRRETQSRQLNARLTALATELSKREDALKVQEEKVAEQAKQLEGTTAPYEEQITQLNNQIVVLKAREAETVKRLTAQHKQRLEDAKNYPEYAESTDKRERIRRAGVN